MTRTLIELVVLSSPSTSTFIVAIIIMSSTVGPRSTIILLRPLGLASDILPSGIESASRTRKQALLFLLLKVGIKLILVKLGCPEKSGDEDDEIDGQERKLRPEIDDAEEREIDRDAVDEGAHYRWCTDILSNGVGGKLGTSPNRTLVV